MPGATIETQASGLLEIHSEQISVTTAKDYAITIPTLKSSSFNVKEITLSANSLDDGTQITVIRKDSNSTADERDATHADSAGVFFGKYYLDYNAKIEPTQNWSNKGLRLYINPVGSDDTVNVTVKYEPRY